MNKITYIMKDMDKTQQKKIIQGIITPRPIAWVTTLNQNKSINLAPFSYFTMLSPSVLMLSILHKEDGFKDTSKNIFSNNEAVVNIASTDWIEFLDQSSETLPYNQSELEKIGLNPLASKIIKTPGLKEAKVRLETRLLSHHQITDPLGDLESDVFYLRILAITLDEDIIEIDKDYINFERLNPLSRLSGPNYGRSILISDYKRKF